MARPGGPAARSTSIGWRRSGSRATGGARRGRHQRRRSGRLRRGENSMAEPFLSEIRIMSFVFAPKGWALCNGQLLPINQNQALFSLLGTTFGGNGQTTFALPDLRAQTPIHVGSGHTLGEKGGQQAHTLSIAELPTHVHVLRAAEATADNNTATGAYLGSAAALYHAPTSLTSLAAS